MTDKIAEIRARHAQSEKNYIELEATWKAQVHADRATLLAEVDRLRAEIERLTRERDEARYFLKIFVHAHANGNAVPPHLEEQARKALEAKS